MRISDTIGGDLQTRTLTQLKLREICLYLTMEEDRHLRLIVRAGAMPADSNTLRVEALGVVGAVDTWISTWSSAFQKYLTMKSWM